MQYMGNIGGGGSAATLAILEEIEELKKRNKIEIADGVIVAYNIYMAEIAFNCDLKRYNSGWNNIAKLPRELYPEVNIYFNVMRKSVSRDIFEMCVATTGDINLWLPSGTTNVDFRGSVTYIY